MFNDPAMLAKLLVVVMGVVGVLIILLTWFASSASTGFIKPSDDVDDPKKKEKSFTQSMILLIIVGTALFVASLVIFGVGSKLPNGFQTIGEAGGVKLYMGFAALLAITVLILASISLSLLKPSDNTKEDGSEGTAENPNNAAGFLVTMIVLSSVALVVGGGWVAKGPLTKKYGEFQSRRMTGGNSPDMRSEFGFDFEF